MQTPTNMSDTLQEEPHTPAPEDAPTTEAMPTQQEEGTPSAAIAPLEEEVIDGEVTAILEPEQKLPQKQPPYYLMVVGTVLACLLYLAASLLLPLLTPSATVLLIPTEQHLATTTAIQVQGRALPTLTLSQSQTTLATGKRHQDATQAQGEITFYNGQLAEVTLAAGTILTGADGVRIITDQPATIPAANPPIEGQVTVSAHAINGGASGNIPAYDINQACGLTSVLAKNTSAFTGGQNERDDTVVTKQDIHNAVTSLLITLSQVETAAQQAQLHTGEALIPTSCSPHLSTNHKAGDEVKHVSVTVSVTCGGIAYIAHELDQEATQMATVISANRFGTGYIPLGDTHFTITRATITNQAQGMVTVTMKIEATAVYQITPGEKEQMRRLIAGKTSQQAQALLLQWPGVAGAAITINGHAATLPDDPGKITLVMAERL